MTKARTLISNTQFSCQEPRPHTKELCPHTNEMQWKPVLELFQRLIWKELKGGQITLVQDPLSRFNIFAPTPPHHPTPPPTPPPPPTLLLLLLIIKIWS
jgi:hypothetical protein